MSMIEEKILYNKQLQVYNSAVKKLPYMMTFSIDKTKQKLPKAINYRIIQNMNIQYGNEMDADKMIDRQLLEMIGDILDAKKIEERLNKRILDQIFLSIGVFNKLTGGTLTKSEIPRAIEYLGIFKKMFKGAGKMFYYFKFLTTLFKVSNHINAIFQEGHY